MKFLRVFLPLVLLGGCSANDPNVDPGPPAPICKAPTATDRAYYTEITSEVGLAKTDSFEPLATGIVAADVDHDGWVDFFASAPGPRKQPPGTKRTRFLFMNRPDPKDPTKRIFVDALDESGLLSSRDGSEGREVSGVTFADIDNDGDIDAIGCAASLDPLTTDPCSAFLNDGKGHFKLAPEGGDLESTVFSTGSGAWLDYDRDGILDYWPTTIGKWQYSDALHSHMRLYKGHGDGTFTEVSAAVGLPQVLASGSDSRMIFGLTSCDVDLDGDRDMLVAEYGVPTGPNHLFRNDNGVFTDVGKALGIAKGPAGEGGFTFAISCGDLDDDGDIDLFTAELHHAWYAGNDFSEWLRNDTPPGQPLAPFVRPGRDATGFTRPHVGDKWTEGDSKAYFADIDLDGRKDVYITSINYPQQYSGDPDWTHDWLYRQKADGTFEDITKKTPWWNLDMQTLGDAAVVDIDNDGDLDIITGTPTYNSEYLGLTNTLHVFRNDVGQDQNMIRLRLVGTGGSNASGIGARVEIKAGGRVQQQEVLGAWGSTQSDVTLTFGLGATCAIDDITVHWPDAAGTVTHYTGVLPNYAVELRQGDAKPKYRALVTK